MAAKATSSPAEDTSELQAAVTLILQREEARQQQAQRRAKQRRRAQRDEERQAVCKMQHSIEVIKWCIVAICSVWLISFVISIVVLVRVQSKVAEIEGEVERIRNVMDNPFASAGARLGGQVDSKLRELLQIPEPQGGEQ